MLRAWRIYAATSSTKEARRKIKRQGSEDKTGTGENSWKGESSYWSTKVCILYSTCGYTIHFEKVCCMRYPTNFLELALLVEKVDRFAEKL